MFDAQRIEPEMRAGMIVECAVVIILDGLAHETDQAPAPGFPIGPDGIEGLADIWAVARRDETLQVEQEILAADARF